MKEGQLVNVIPTDFWNRHNLLNHHTELMKILNMMWDSAGQLSQAPTLHCDVTCPLSVQGR